jgi:hypothetical protein
MKLKEKPLVKEICEQPFEYGKAQFTDYWGNDQNSVSEFYRTESVRHVKSGSGHSFGTGKISSGASGESLQQMQLSFNNKNKAVPFPEPDPPGLRLLIYLQELADSELQCKIWAESVFLQVNGTCKQRKPMKLILVKFRLVI